MYGFLFAAVYCNYVLSKIADFNLSHLHFLPLLGWLHSNLNKGVKKPRIPPGYCVLSNVSCFDKTLTDSHRQKNERTDGHMATASTAVA